jgi:hypothetical protein
MKTFFLDFFSKFKCNFYTLISIQNMDRIRIQQLNLIWLDTNARASCRCLFAVEWFRNCR